MDDAILLVREGDIMEFYDLLNANFAGNVTDYMEASCRILRSVTGEREIVMRSGGRLESIVELSRPRRAPQGCMEAYPFAMTRRMRKDLKTLKSHWHFRSQDDASIFYSASRTYQAIAERYLDGADFVEKKREAVIDLDFGGVLDLVRIAEHGDENAWTEGVHAWMKRGQNNMHGLAPVQINAMARRMYYASRALAYPRKEILRMYRYQERFKRWRGYLSLVRN